MPVGGGFDETSTSFRFRLREPGRFQEGSFRTKEIDNGISLVLGRIKGETSLTAQSIIFSKKRFKKQSDAQKWLTDHGGRKAFHMEDDEMVMDFAEPEFKEIKDVEIFATGKWNGDKFTEKDLDGIVQSFDETKDKLKPFVKIGHNERQSLLAKDELPSAGLVENVRRVGRKLVADFKNVPKKIYEIIKRKAFDKVSSELFVNINVNGRKHPLCLKAVALLGGETPAVHDLDSIMGLFSDAESVAAFNNLDSKEYEIGLSYFNQTMQEDKKMEELLKKIDKLEAENKSFQEEAAQANADAAKAEEDKKKAETDAAEANKKAEEAEKGKAEAEKKVADAEAEKKNALIDAKVQKYIDDGKVKPYQGRILTELLKKAIVEGEKTFSIQVSESETKEFKSIDELVDEFINSDVELPMEEKTGMGEETGDDALVNKAKKYMEEHKGVSFKEALIKVFPEGK